MSNPFSSFPAFNIPPRTWDIPSEQFNIPDIRPLYYESVPYHGKNTKVFAWIGLPKGADENHPVPGIVLVHGGGGTAHADWVKLWTDLGYAAIAMDNCGAIPSWAPCPWCADWPRHVDSGPRGWGEIGDVRNAIEDQWPYHAVAAVLNAFALLRSMKEVQLDNIGVTGISWGGYLTCIAASLDSRFKYAMPVYGCGGFGPDRGATLCNYKQLVACGTEKDLTPEMEQKWFELWDPDLYLPQSKVPFLWLTDAEDTPFPLDCWLHSTTLTKTPGTARSLRINFVHDHTRCYTCKTLPNYAKAIQNGVQCAPVLQMPTVENGKISCALAKGPYDIAQANLAYTTASGAWGDRRWHSVPAEIMDNSLTAPLPFLCHDAFFQVVDTQGSTWSSPVLFEI